MGHAKIRNYDTTFHDDFGKTLKNLQWSTNDDKTVSYLIVSQIGDFQENMNEVATRSNYETYAAVFVVKQMKDRSGPAKGRNCVFLYLSYIILGNNNCYFQISDYYYESRYLPPENENYSPMAFVAQSKLPCTNDVAIISGSQLRKRDCFKRCLQFVNDICNNDNSLSTSRTFTVGRRQ